MKPILKYTCLACLMLLASCRADNRNSGPLNILFIMTDQQSATMMSCTGNEYLHTPALDRLASEGMRFELAENALEIILAKGEKNPSGEPSTIFS